MAALLAGAATAACAEEPRSPEAARGEYAVEALRPDSLLRTLRPGGVAGEDEGAIEEGFALAIDGDRIFVLDMIGARVHAFRPDAASPGSIGREGEGPGELRAPVTLRVDPEGDVWVSQADPPRISRFRPSGEPVAQFRPPYPAVSFAVLDGGRPLIPTLDAASLLAELEADGDTLVWSVDPAIPARLRREPLERILFFSYLLARRGPDELVVLQNRHGDDFSLWSLALDAGSRRIETIEPVPLPEWLYGLMRREAERTRRESPPDFAQGDFMIPFKGLHMGREGRVQLVPSPSRRALLLELPGGKEEPLRVVVPSERGEHRGMMDAVLADGRLVALYSTEVRVYVLGPAAEGHRKELGIPEAGGDPDSGR